MVLQRTDDCVWNDCRGINNTSVMETQNYTLLWIILKRNSVLFYVLWNNLPVLFISGCMCVCAFYKTDICTLAKTLHARPEKSSSRSQTCTWTAIPVYPLRIASSSRFALTFLVFQNGACIAITFVCFCYLDKDFLPQKPNFPNSCILTLAIIQQILFWFHTHPDATVYFRW